MAGRPELQPEDLKKKITFRLTDKKRAELQQKADIYTGGNLSAYIEKVLFSDNRNSIDLPNSESKLDRYTLYSMVREINKMGSNLNQLTKKAHQGGFVETKIVGLLEEIKMVNTGIFDLLIKTLEFRKD